MHAGLGIRPLNVLLPVLSITFLCSRVCWCDRWTSEIIFQKNNRIGSGLGRAGLCWTRPFSPILTTSHVEPPYKIASSNTVLLNEMEIDVVSDLNEAKSLIELKIGSESHCYPVPRACQLANSVIVGSTEGFHNQALQSRCLNEWSSSAIPPSWQSGLAEHCLGVG